jgi:hypothetical protein
MATQQAVSESNVLHNKFEVGEGDPRRRSSSGIAAAVIHKCLWSLASCYDLRASNRGNQSSLRPGAFVEPADGAMGIRSNFPCISHVAHAVRVFHLAFRRIR